MAAKTSTTKKTTKRSSVAPPPPAAHGPTTEEIALRAFELFLARGGQHGHHEEDWHRAERELRERRAVS